MRQTIIFEVISKDRQTDRQGEWGGCLKGVVGEGGGGMAKGKSKGEGVGGKIVF